MIVLDASVAVKLVSMGPGHEAALERVVREVDRIAPEWILIEVANALVRKVKGDVLPSDIAMAAFAAVPDLLTELVEPLSLLDEAIRLAMRLQHPVYDCMYLALALARDAVVLTADGGLVHAAVEHGLGQHVERVR